MRLGRLHCFYKAHLWPTPVLTWQAPEADLQSSLTSLALLLERSEPSATASNRGGWQSANDLHKRRLPPIARLVSAWWISGSNGSYFRLELPRRTFIRFLPIRPSVHLFAESHAESVLVLRGSYSAWLSLIAATALL